jgi:hypothetical protein
VVFAELPGGEQHAFDLFHFARFDAVSTASRLLRLGITDTMQTTNFGRLGTVSALTLGGGRIGGVFGTTQHTEAIQTVRMAIDFGITMIDVAPSYGTYYEAEVVAGEALRGRSTDVMITTKVQLPDNDPGDLAYRITTSLHASMARLGRSHIDLFSYIRNCGQRTTRQRQHARSAGTAVATRSSLRSFDSVTRVDTCLGRHRCRLSIGNRRGVAH